ncbi:MAG: phosphoribosyl-AMP cyclohydrolase [Neisseriaceae bacterium]|nr:phosphoribosyl-AMP cyclohydrolase [Neisseriaceae bacterium]
MDTIESSVKFNQDGLLCTVVQDVDTKSVLMVAWMNKEALNQTIKTGLAHYYSRSRQKQWLKGEESGHLQKVHSLHIDCDGDTLLLQVEQVGGIACHTGHQSCFYRKLQGGELVETAPVIKHAQDIYGSKMP